MRAHMRKREKNTIIISILLALLVFVEFLYYKPSLYTPGFMEKKYNVLDYAAHDTPERRFSPPPMARFREITDRPLFTPTRRQAVLIRHSPIEVFLLRGVVLSQRHNTALVERRSDGALLRLREGDQVEKWQVKFIDADSIEFSGSRRTYMIKMTNDIEASLRNHLAKDLTSEEEQVDDVDAGEVEFNPLWRVRVSGGQASHRPLPPRSGAQAAERRNVGYPTALPRELPPPPPSLVPSHNRTRRS